MENTYKEMINENITKHIKWFIKNNKSVNKKIKYYNYLFNNEESYEDVEIIAPLFNEVKCLILELLKENVVPFEYIQEYNYDDDSIKDIDDYINFINDLRYDEVDFYTFECDVQYEFYCLIGEVLKLKNIDFTTIDSNLWKIIPA